MLLVECIHTFMQPATLEIEPRLINQRRNHITAHGGERISQFNVKLYSDLSGAPTIMEHFLAHLLC